MTFRALKKSPTRIQQNFSCRLDEGIAMICKKVKIFKKTSERIFPHRIGRFEDDSSYSAQLAPAQWHVLTKFSEMEIITTKFDPIPLGGLL